MCAAGSPQGTVLFRDGRCPRARPAPQTRLIRLSRWGEAPPPCSAAPSSLRYGTGWTRVSVPALPGAGPDPALPQGLRVSGGASDRVACGHPRCHCRIISPKKQKEVSEG